MFATCLCTKKFLNYRTDSDIKNDIFLLLLIVKGNKYFLHLFGKYKKGEKYLRPWSSFRHHHCCLFSRELTFFFFIISWRLINLQYVVGFVIHWHESAMDIHAFPIPIPPPTSLSTQSLWVFPVHQAWALVSCIQPGLMICFTLDSMLVSMLFSWNIPPSPSPTESKSLFYTPVSLFLFCI